MVGDLGLPCRLQDDLVDEAWMNARWPSSPRSRTPTSGKAGSRPCVAWHQAFTSTSAMGTCAKDASTTPGLQLDAGLARSTLPNDSYGALIRKGLTGLRGRVEAVHP